MFKGITMETKKEFDKSLKQEEFDKWHTFVVAILKKGILTDPTQ